MAVLTARLCRLTYKVKTSQEIICGKKLSMRLQKKLRSAGKAITAGLEWTHG
jgi:hypothetical protein